MTLQDLSFDNCRGYLLERLEPKIYHRTNETFNHARASNLSSFVEWKMQVFKALGNCEVLITKPTKESPFVVKIKSKTNE